MQRSRIAKISLTGAVFIFIAMAMAAGPFSTHHRSRSTPADERAR